MFQKAIDLEEVESFRLATEASFFVGFLLLRRSDRVKLMNISAGAIDLEKVVASHFYFPPSPQGSYPLRPPLRGNTPLAFKNRSELFHTAILLYRQL